ncbi:hypothetical protein VSH64_36635 [Amycolatopsis rhabdoformis]|uniref:Tetracycline repressor TetR C-terminal domain-containing protein n=1 Tax=Amycolatopsis rhabdoformis TaxID=1448059 RepID=A0ABZ1I2A0_9PSEU|nr:hypothetical protein [Amycolatopsis rhabdoformis]WSE28325.1 hypothetical protein VSH64_36635 [Amycolatopsis rhabdoformis]
MRSGLSPPAAFPALATVVRDGPHPDADRMIRTGLDFLVGIEARISAR